MENAQLPIDHLVWCAISLCQLLPSYWLGRSVIREYDIFFASCGLFLCSNWNVGRRKQPLSKLTHLVGFCALCVANVFVKHTLQCIKLFNGITWQKAMLRHINIYTHSQYTRTNGAVQHSVWHLLFFVRHKK